MKKLYGAIGSIALLFSMPSLAAVMVEKAEKSPQEKQIKEANKLPADKTEISSEPKADAKAPICFTGG